MVSRDKLSKKSLDETEVERDYSIRRKITALYNKKESDFANLEDYKNYEETVEDIIYNLVNLIDVDATNQLIEKYKLDNSKEITMNQFKRKEELKGELISIKEREEAIAAANQKFQVLRVCCIVETTVQYMAFYNSWLHTTIDVWWNTIGKSANPTRSEDGRQTPAQSTDVGSKSF